MSHYKPLSIYIHVPYCMHKCGYCDFYSEVCGSFDTVDTVKFDPFVDAVIAEYNRYVSGCIKSEVDKTPYTIFFGGGTPSLLSPSQIKRILDVIDPLQNNARQSQETTIEANPDTVTYEKLAGYREAGISRLSIGVQSFDNAVLKVLNRTHKPENVYKTVEWAKQLGLPFSLDLIYGAPGESLKSWIQTVEQAIALEPNHISAYALTLEDNVPLAGLIRAGKYPAIDPDEQAEKYKIADELLASAGYNWYEISNWAQSSPSLHNLHYWQGGNWLGLGPGAHGCLDITAHKHNSLLRHHEPSSCHPELDSGSPLLHRKPKREIPSQAWNDMEGAYRNDVSGVHSVQNDIACAPYTRYWNTSNLTEYLNNPQTPECEQITDVEAVTEFIMLQSRLNQNLPKKLNLNEAFTQSLIAQYLLNTDGTLTLKGRMLNDELIRQVDEYLTEEMMEIPNQVWNDMGGALQNKTSKNGNADIKCERYQTTRCMSCPQCVVI